MSRRARKGASDRTTQNSDLQHQVVDSKEQDSGKFSVLATLERDLRDVQEPSVEDTGVGSVSKALSVLNEGMEASMSQRIIVEGSVPDTRSGRPSVELVNGSGSNSKALQVRENVVIERFDVASSERIVPARVSLNPEAHMDVHVLDNGREKVQSLGRGHRNSVGDGTSGPKVNPRKPIHTSGDKKNMPNRRKSVGHSSSKVMLGEWIGDLENELLRNGKSTDASPAVNQVERRESLGSNMQWRDNTTFANDM
ncbi:hypothetical protein V6N11_067709 [Hibiscus sabdariffa]|uniref:Uncharacterized protein n=1 Tax=Hibiscus sabdariffa TaxID=183260 RepID=A0ABR2SRJ8_9ROSI